MDVCSSPATGCAMLDVAMHVDVVNTVVINRLAADVSQFATDPDNAPLWYENIKSADARATIPHGDDVHVGRRARRHADGAS